MLEEPRKEELEKKKKKVMIWEAIALLKWSYSLPLPPENQRKMIIKVKDSQTLFLNYTGAIDKYLI